MQWLFFDDILERHVAAGLAEALRRRGHFVRETGPIWKGHEFPQTSDDRERIFEALEEALASAPDVMMVFRPTTLTPKHMKWLATKPIRTMVWLADDPVLYRSYSKIVDSYDDVLHGGGGVELLQFYDRRGHRPGYILPFWADLNRFPFIYDVSTATEGDIVFFGNCAGPAKIGRYRAIERFAAANELERIAIFGRVDNDARGWSRGYIDDEAELIARLPGFKMSVNIPQRFSDYRGTRHDFGGLSELGYFDIASRVVQLASLGLPQVAIGPTQVSAHFPTLIWSDQPARDVPAAWRFDRRILNDEEVLMRLSKQARLAFETDFTADARAEFLLELVEDRHRPESVDKRYIAYRRS